MAHTIGRHLRNNIGSMGEDREAGGTDTNKFALRLGQEDMFLLNGESAGLLSDHYVPWQPSSSHFSARYLLLTGMVCGQWQRSHSRADYVI